MTPRSKAARPCPASSNAIHTASHVPLPGEMAADMFCLLRLEDEDLFASLAEYRHLEHSIGTTGLLALKPLQVTTHRDHWHQFLLKESAASARSVSP